MKTTLNSISCIIGLLLSTALPLAALAQQRTLNDGVYTEAQAESGEQVYQEYCLGCHNERFYRQAWSGWENRTVEQFWFYIVGEMPQDNPGFLSDQEYTDVTAFIFSILGFPAGDTPLDPYDGMDQIKIVLP